MIPGHAGASGLLETTEPITDVFRSEETSPPITESVL